MREDERREGWIEESHKSQVRSHKSEGLIGNPKSVFGLLLTSAF
jgi:hypothetical protein